MFYSFFKVERNKVCEELSNMRRDQLRLEREKTTATYRNSTRKLWRDDMIAVKVDSLAVEMLNLFS